MEVDVDAVTAGGRIPAVGLKEGIDCDEESADLGDELDAVVELLGSALRTLRGEFNPEEGIPCLVEVLLKAIVNHTMIRPRI